MPLWGCSLPVPCPSCPVASAASAASAPSACPVARIRTRSVGRLATRYPTPTAVRVPSQNEPMAEVNEQDRVAHQRPDEPAAPGGDACCFSEALCNEFKAHAERLRVRSRDRRDATRLRSVVNDREEREQVNEEDMLGRRQPQDEYQGDVNLRTLRSLLKMIDERGFERSPHQMRFHSAFERSTARVLYKDDWGTQRPSIMKKNNWPTCSSEVLISTPRRFGKTFSIAIFAACLALTMKCEVVVFSPARRASRKLLERMIEFVRLLGHEPIEYNQGVQGSLHTLFHAHAKYCALQNKRA